MKFQDLIIIWVLIFTRLSMMFVFLPIFNSRNIPMKAKIALISMFSLVFLSSGAFNYTQFSYNTAYLGKSVVFEAVNGITLGFGVMLVMNSIYVAGQIIDMNMGFSMVNVMSAQDESSIPITANLYYIFMLIIFITLNAHYAVIDAFAISLDKVPLGELAFNSTHLAGFTELMSMTFELAFRIAIPIILTVLVSNLILGLLSKAMPGMNVFMVGMPFKILIGLATILLVLPSTHKVFVEIIEIMADFLAGVVGRMYL